MLLPVIASLVPFVMLASMAAAQPGDNGSADVATALTSDRFHFSDDQLRGLADILLAESPLVSSAWARSRSSFERVPQDLSLPDPRISYRYFAETPETRVGPQEHMLELSQALPWTGKRRLQAERSHNVAASRTWEAEDLERRLVAQLKRAYFGVAYMQEALRVNREEQEILRRFESIALTRYATGQGIQQNVVKVQTEISRLGDRETELRERLDVALRRISALIGRSDVKLSIRPIRLPLPDVVYDREDLEAFALSGHPRVNAVERKIEADRTWTRRRELETKPDFRVGLGYTSVGRRDDLAGTISPPEENGKDILTLTAGVNIPIFRKRIRAGVAEARESERANQELLSAVQDGLRFEIQEALLQAESLSERAGLYLEVIIPQAEESLASAEAAYTTDRLGFLDLLDAERVLFQSRLAYHRLVSDLWIALAGLEESTARPFPSVPQEERAGVTPETGIRP
ncbi:MAG: TolC family protein [Acidobacteriota bacterium]|nr:TolC family protein [Acidobacteriota bacterium]